MYYFERCTNDESCVKAFVPDFLVCFLINVKLVSVRHILTFALFPCFFFQAECPLCREPVQLPRLVFLHHYEPT